MVGIKTYKTQEELKEARKRNMAKYRSKKKALVYAQKPKLNLDPLKRKQLNNLRRMGPKASVRKSFRKFVLPQLNAKLSKVILVE